MSQVISIGHQTMTRADLRVIIDHANRLIAEGIVGELLIRHHELLGEVVSFMDDEREVICHLFKRAGRYAVYGREGNLVLDDPLLQNALALLPTTLEPGVEARPKVSPKVTSRLVEDRAMAIGQGGRPGVGFLAHR